MLTTHSKTKRPHEALLQLDIELTHHMYSVGGSSPIYRGTPMRHHPCVVLILTSPFMHKDKDANTSDDMQTYAEIFRISQRKVSIS